MGARKTDHFTQESASTMQLFEAQLEEVERVIAAARRTLATLHEGWPEWEVAARTFRNAEARRHRILQAINDFSPRQK
jgi:hypothetical protein